MLHPGTAFVTVHNEMAQIPEEFVRDEGVDAKKKAAAPTSKKQQQTDHPEEEGPFLTAASPPIIIPHKETPPTPPGQPLHALLPFHGDLPELSQLPFLDHTTSLLKPLKALEQNREYTVLFRQKIGGCTKLLASRRRVVKELQTGDLFCADGLEMELGAEEEEDEKEAADAGVEEIGFPVR